MHGGLQGAGESIQTPAASDTRDVPDTNVQRSAQRAGPPLPQAARNIRNFCGLVNEPAPEWAQPPTKVRKWA